MLTLSHRLKSLTLLVLASSVILSLAVSPIADAAKKWTDWGPKSQVAAFTVYDSMTGCLLRNFNTSFDTNDSASNYVSPDDMFGDQWRGLSRDKNEAFTYPEVGGKSCQQVFRIITDQWDISQADFLKGIGCTNTKQASNGQKGRWSCKSKSATSSTFKTFIGNQLGVQPTLTDAGRYLLYLNALQKQCGGKSLGPYSDLKGDLRTKVDQNSLEGNRTAKDGLQTGDQVRYKKVTLVDSDGKTKEFGYSYVEKNGTSDKQAVLYGRTSGVKMSCADMSRHISNVAAPYASAAKAAGEDIQGPGTSTGEGGEDETSSCSVTGLGWIVCPVVIFLGWVTDGSYTALQKFFLIDGSMFSGEGDNNQVYELWTYVRNIANALFVLAFLLIVISQITSIGLSNYSIKRMLPRILLVAIAVNVSFWVCAALVDISNFLGTSIKSYLDTVVGSNISDPVGGAWSGAGFEGWGAIGAGLLISTGALAATAYFSIAAFVGLAITVILAIITVVVVLSVRQALIIMLVCLAPLAFCAYLLPNTENLLSKWWNLFKILLLLFPIVGFIFGASSIASTVIMGAAKGDIFVQLVGAAVAVIPLFITPVVMKGAGGLLNKIGAITNDKSRGPLDGLRNKAKKYDDERSAMRNQRRNTRALSGKSNSLFAKNRRRIARRQAKWGNVQAESEAAQAAFNLNDDKARGYSMDTAHANMAANAAKSGLQSTAYGELHDNPTAVSSKLGNAGLEGGAAAAALAGQRDAAKADAIKNVTATIDHNDATALGKIFQDAMVKGDTITALASQNLLGGMGNKGASIIAKSIDGAENSEGGIDAGTRLDVARNMSGGTMDKREDVKQWATSTEAQEVNGQTVGVGKSYKDAYADALNKAGDLSIQKLAAQEPTLQREMVSGKEVTRSDGSKVTAGGNVSKETIEVALDPKNIGAFEQGTQDAMRKALKNATSEIDIPHNTPPSTSSNGRQTPGGVSNPDDYHGRMSK